MKYCIITFGCQANKSDSEKIASFLEKNGLQKTSEKEADFVVINSCSVRQSAVDRMEAKIREIKKRKKPPVTALTGCVLQKDKKKLKPFFDYMLPEKELFPQKIPFLKKGFLKEAPKREKPTAYITIMSGCDNFCSYCVVPYTKGRESSRPAKEVVEEAKKTIKEGYRDIWLLGQNVNSYKGGVKFSNLLREINKIRGDFWVRFTSSHPKDFSSDIISVIKNCKKITNYLHLPVQSGDDEILKKMNRSYTSEQYKKAVNEAKKEIPGLSVSTDIIVGFPGETEKQFHNTVKLVKEIGFDMIYIGRYSPRMQTAAYNMKETVSEEEKRRREKILEELLKESNLEKNKKLVGRKIRVLTTQMTKKNLLSGKTEGYKSVLFKGPKSLIGEFVKIKITGYSSWGLKGKISRK